MRKPAHPWSHLTVYIRVLTVSGLGIEPRMAQLPPDQLAMASFNDCRFCDQCDGPIYVAFRGRIERSTSYESFAPPRNELHIVVALRAV
jgi:hypothetical protein